jgi:hypothetical protein
MKQCLRQLKSKTLLNPLKNAQTQFTFWADAKRNPNRTVKQLIEKLDTSFFKLLDELTIARSRKHIKNFYKAQAEVQNNTLLKIYLLIGILLLPSNFSISSYSLKMQNCYI